MIRSYGHLQLAWWGQLGDVGKSIKMLQVQCKSR